MTCSLLKIFKLRGCDYRPSTDPLTVDPSCLNHISEFLGGGQHLEHLELEHVCTPSILEDELTADHVSARTFPRVRVLVLRDIWLTSDEALSDFLDRHPSIQQLSLVGAFSSDSHIVLSETSLPGLVSRSGTQRSVGSCD